MERRCQALLTLALLLACAPLALWWVRPPRPLGRDADPHRFSAERARAHLEWIAAEPRPLGSAANARVRERLARELASLGLEVEERALPFTGELLLHDLVARRPAAKDSVDPATLLVVLHHDSVPSGPGAGDDGSSVAALLEALRALALEPAGRNELRVLVTDGEEAGLLGAIAFVQDEANLERVACVLNFEARGSAGPSILFQVGPASGGLVRAYARSAPHPTGSSLGAAVFERMPNDTDFSVFLARDFPGLNFAFIGGGAVYHTSADTLDNLSASTLQQHGEAMLGLLRELKDADLAELGAEAPREFFLMSGLPLSYPRAWALPLGVLAAVVALFGAWRASGARFGRLLGGTVLAITGFALAAAVLIGAARGVHTGIGVLGERFGWFQDARQGSNAVSGEVLVLGLWALAVGLALSEARIFRGLFGAGAALLWALAAVLLPLFVPGGGYVALFAALGCGASAAILPRKPDAAPVAPIRVFLAWLPAALVLFPLAALLVQVGSVQPGNEALLGGGAVALLLSSAFPLAVALSPRVPRALVAACVGVGLLLLVLRSGLAWSGA